LRVIIPDPTHVIPL